MEYVDGGWRKVVNIFGAGVRLSGSETSRFLSYYPWITGAISSAAGLASGPAGAIAGIIYAAYGGTIQKFNSNNSGVTIVIPCISIYQPFSCPVPPIVIDTNSK